MAGLDIDVSGLNVDVSAQPDATGLRRNVVAAPEGTTRVRFEAGESIETSDFNLIFPHVLLSNTVLTIPQYIYDQIASHPEVLVTRQLGETSLDFQFRLLLFRKVAAVLGPTVNPTVPLITTNLLSAQRLLGVSYGPEVDYYLGQVVAAMP